MVKTTTLSCVAPGYGVRVGQNGHSRSIAAWIQPFQAVRNANLGRWGQSSLGLFILPAYGQTQLVDVIDLNLLQPRGHAPGQPVAIELQRVQDCEVVQLPWDRPAQLVVAEVQVFQTVRATQFGRYGAGQLVVIELERKQAWQVAQLLRDRPAQQIFSEVQHFQTVQPAQLRPESFRSAGFCRVTSPAVC